MSTTALARRPRARRPLAVAGLALLALLASACQGTWGIRTSYRSYVAGPGGQGSITPEDGVVWKDAAGPGKGPFTWNVDWATFDPETTTGSVQMKGGVVTKAHPLGDAHALELSVWNPRLDIDGDEGTLVADLTYRPFTGTDPTTLPAIEAATDVPFATVDLSGVGWTRGSGGYYSIKDAPMVGIDAAMELIGWDDFYGTEVALDPLTVSFDPDTFAPQLFPAPQVVVSQTEGLRPGDQVIVWGRGFDPAAHTGTRPPLSGQPSGHYVVFGRFADDWAPSGGAPSSARSVIAQRWAVPAAQHLALDPAQTNASFTRLDELGRFQTVLTVGAGGTTGTYGVYTYAASGAVDAAQELAIPVQLIGG
ncbi:MAG: HtaA domain-containing protein [Acidimicrobiales bacterium]|nr:HtaA domain-containing protein [Acidimicrobiales bacterium]HRW36167.1 HtaA domain-containing protein [Aquihabitans sp.]